MNGVFWNSDGFRDPKNFRFISDLTKEHNMFRDLPNGY